MNLCIIIFPVALKMVQVWGKKALEQEVRTEQGAPVSTKKVSDRPATSGCTLGSTPMMVICDGWADWSGLLQSC